MALLLTDGISLKCPHGGTATIASADKNASIKDKKVLLLSDPVVIAGCPYVDPAKQSPSPCIKVTWSGPATKVTIGSQAVLTKTSVGTCVNADGSPQGVASIDQVQTNVDGK